MFQMKDQARQGDVFLLTVGELPKNVQQIAAEGGRTILQHGEVTGHAHAIIATPRVALYAETGSGSGGRRFLVVDEDARTTIPVFGEPKIVGHKPRTEFTVTKDQDGELIFSDERPVLLDGEPILDPIFEPVQIGTKEVPGTSLQHEEHGTITVPPGVHEIRIHREYVAPQIERQVAD